jgi:transposase-like protein
MIARGLRAPALVIADGAPGIWKATRELWPDALEQRCTVHALRNVTGKLPERHHTEVKARWWRAFDEARSAGEATRELQGITADYKTAYPSAMAVIETDLPALVTHLRFRLSIASGPGPTNLLEKTFVEVRRRTKVIGRFPRRDIRPVTDLGGAGAHNPRLARREDEPQAIDPRLPRRLVSGTSGVSTKLLNCKGSHKAGARVAELECVCGPTGTLAGSSWPLPSRAAGGSVSLGGRWRFSHGLPHPRPTSSFPRCYPMNA